LHTARSRNDQVALDLRLHAKDEIKRTAALLKKLQKAFLRLAEKHVDLVMPGYTHLQRAQPILLAIIFWAKSKCSLATAIVSTIVIKEPMCFRLAPARWQDRPFPSIGIDRARARIRADQPEQSRCGKRPRFRLRIRFLPGHD